MLTLRMKLPPKYVLDEMKMYEVRALMDYEYYSRNDTWEQARLIAYMVAQVNSKRRLKFSDITQFYWEDKEEEKDTSISREEIERLRKKAETYINNIKQKKDNGGISNQSEGKRQSVTNRKRSKKVSG